MLISDLIADSRNANKGTERGKEMLLDSLQRYGAGRSILLDKHNRVIAGNKTAEGAQAAGITDVIVVPVTGNQLVAVQRVDLDLEQDDKAKQLAIADNRVGEISLNWDPEVLQQIGQEVDLSGLFGDDEFKRVLDTLIQPTELQTDPDAVPETPEEPSTRPGDLYKLGNHRLLCGDSTNITDVERLMAADRADAIWTDPPYNVAYEGKTADRMTIENDSMDNESFRAFLYDAFVSMFSVAREGCAIYIAHADSEGYNFRGAMTDAGWDLKQCLIWAKNSFVLGRQDYHWMHEPILYGWKPGAAHSWYSDRSQSTLLQFDKPQRNGDHPTMKPVALVEYCLSNSSKQGDVVLDLFGGSGTTLIACEKLGRRARLMELDPRYCDVIVQRFKAATGKEVQLVRQ